jgi:hypothetical protein
VDHDARENAFLSALTTEHFVLQSARGALVSEMVGRGSVYLGTVSSSLIAFGFLAQVGTRVDLFAAAVLPALYVFGELTFVALLRNSLVNLEFLRRIQRIRGYYRGLHPDAEQFFDPVESDTELGVELATVGMRRGAGAMLFTGASTVAAVNSIVGGVGLSLLAGRYALIQGGSTPVAGIATAVLLFGLHLLYQRRRATAALAAAIDVRTPTMPAPPPPDDVSGRSRPGRPVPMTKACAPAVSPPPSSSSPPA